MTLSMAENGLVRVELTVDAIHPALICIMRISYTNKYCQSPHTWRMCVAGSQTCPTIFHLLSVATLVIFIIITKVYITHSIDPKDQFY